MNYIFCFLFLMGISGTQGQDVGCLEAAVDCPSICTCWNEKKKLSTHQTQLLNKECHMCGKSGRKSFPIPAMAEPSPLLNSEGNAKNLESDEDN